MTPPWHYDVEDPYGDFRLGVVQGLYVCALFATVNCVVFAFALKKKLFSRDSDS